MIYLNGNPLPVTLFPDNTSQVWKLPNHIFENDSWVYITWEFSHEGEFMQLAQLKNLLDSKGVRSGIRLNYLPYGRQDKDVSNTSTFALHTFAKLLNSLEFEEVNIIDPHSVVALQLIKNSKPLFPRAVFETVVQKTGSNLFCYPDKGALSKYVDVYGSELNHIHGEKVRNQDTGIITSYEVIGNPKDKKVLIVDDICDGGATFVILAKELLDKGAKEVNLFVTHGIFSKGLKPLYESGIKKVFTKDGEAGMHQNNITYRRL